MCTSDEVLIKHFGLLEWRQ